MSDEKTGKLHDIDVPEYLIDCVKIDDLLIDEEFMRAAADLAYWNERFAVALKRHLRAKVAADRARAMATIGIREVNAGVKMTVADLEARVELDPDVISTVDECVEADAARSHMRVRAEAVAAKKDMLQSLGAKLREEMRDPSVREDHVGRKLVRDSKQRTD